jgi:hypothetical protein
MIVQFALLVAVLVMVGLGIVAWKEWLAGRDRRTALTHIPEPPPLPAPITDEADTEWAQMTEEEREEYIAALGQSIVDKKGDAEVEAFRRPSGPADSYNADAHCPACGSRIRADLLHDGRIACPGCMTALKVKVVTDEKPAVSTSFSLGLRPSRSSSALRLPP